MILITSDFHLGYGYNSEREKDCFWVLDEILNEKNISLILFAGDLFDSRVPRLEVLSEAVHFLSKLKENKSNVRILECDKEINNRFHEGIPFISIYGNHERRSNIINPVQVLEKAGLLINLHCQKIILEIDGLKICIHGMSHIPDRYVKDVLKEWNPKPIKNAINILLLHQNIEPFVYSDLEDVYLKISDLPKGFDYIVNGHIHYSKVLDLDNGKLIIPGSTIPTQLNKTESQIKKGYYLLNRNNLIFKEIKQRKFFYLEADSLESIDKFLSNLEIQTPKPIIKFKIGSLSKIDINLLENKYKDKGILIFGKKIEERGFCKYKAKIIEKQLSAEEYGLKLLKEKMRLSNIIELFDALSDENFDEVTKLLKENYNINQK
ncbi:MAG: hypothetical protein B6U88_02625 [Candidatus Aenigmarchaeota archaeon ex4484_56]|nr:MAG: hypothetical protein B6U88_02625 [Candidatus Aenigmarchaeota archaeon ex4484_56]